MDCADVRDQFLRGTLPSGAELEEHLRTCEQCTELYRDRGRLGRIFGSRPTTVHDEHLALWGDLERSLTQETGARAWLRSRPTILRVIFVCAVALLLAGVGVAGLRVDVVRLQLRLASWALLAALGLVGGASVLLESLARKARPSWFGPVVGVLLLSLPAVFLVLWSPAVGTSYEHGFWHSVLACLLYGSTLAVPVLVAFKLLDRSVAPDAQRMLLGAAIAGLVGNSALMFHCPIADPAHLLLGHASIGLVLVLSIGALRLLKSPRRARG